MVLQTYKPRPHQSRAGSQVWSNKKAGTHLVDDVQEPGDVLLELAARVVVLGPRTLAVAVAPGPVLVAGAARVRAGAGRQRRAREVGSDPGQRALPPGRGTTDRSSESNR